MNFFVGQQFMVPLPLYRTEKGMRFASVELDYVDSIRFLPAGIKKRCTIVCLPACKPRGLSGGRI